MNSLKKHPYRYLLFGLLFGYSSLTPLMESLQLVQLKQPFFSRNWTLLTPTALVYDRLNFFSYSIISLWDDQGNLIIKKGLLNNSDDHKNFIDGRILSKLVTGSFYDDPQRIIGQQLICKHLIKSMPENVSRALVEYYADVKDALPRKLEVNCAKEIEETLKARQYVITRNAIAVYFFLYFCAYLQVFKFVSITNTLSYSPVFLRNFSFLATDTFLISICLFGILLSIVLFLGVMDRVVALLFYFLLLTLNFVNLFIYQLHIAFFSIMLLTFVIFSNQKFFRINKLFSKSDYISKDWQLFLYGMMCLILTISGLSKVFVFEWRDGSIMGYLCKISVVSYYFEDFFCSLPKAFFAFLTYTALFLEIASFPLFLFKKTRRFTLYLELALFAGITIEVGHVYNMTALMMIYTFFCFPFNRKTES